MIWGRESSFLFVCCAFVLASSVYIPKSIGQDAEGATDESEEAESKPLRILLLQGGANHPYAMRQQVLQHGIEQRISCDIQWTLVTDLSGRSDVKLQELLDDSWKWDFDVILHDHCFPRVHDTEYVKSLLVPHQKGIPAILLHASLTSFPVEVGGQRIWQDLSGAVIDREVSFDAVTATALEGFFSISEGKELSVLSPDELYRIENLSPGAAPVWQAKGGDPTFDEPVAWTHRFGPEDARVFATSLGNQVVSLAEPALLDLIAKSVIWAVESEDELFIEIAPDQSLRGIDLNSVPLNPLRPGVSKALDGRALALSENRGAKHFARMANDGQIETYWESALPGPDSWEIEYPTPILLSGIAIAWKDGVPRDFQVEYSRDGLDWIEISASRIFKRLEKQGMSFRRLKEETEASRVRITVLSSRPGVRPGIREVGLYDSPISIPSVFRVGFESGDGLNSVPGQPEGHPVRLANPWQLREVGELPFSGAPQDWFETASGSLFLIGTPDQNGKTTIWLGAERDGQFSWTPFLNNREGPIAAFWDGEWLTVAENKVLVPYRDSDQDGIADEKNADQEFPIPSEGIRKMRLGMEGNVYGLAASSGSSNATKSESHRLIRFRRDGSGVTELFSSDRPLRQFWMADSSQIYLQWEGDTERPFRCLPLHDPVLTDDFRDSWRVETALNPSLGAPIFEVAGEKVFCLSPAGEEGRKGTQVFVAEIPGLLDVRAMGADAFALHQRGASTRISRLSRNFEAPVSVDLDEVGNDDLVPLLDSESSAVRRETVFELFRRRRDLTKKVILAGADFSEYGKEARLAYLSQLPPEQSRDFLVSAAKNGPKQWGYYLLGQHPSAKNLEVFRNILEIDEPEITSQALAALIESESNWEELDSLIYDWTTYNAEVLAGTATSYLIRRGLDGLIWQTIEEGESVEHGLSLLRYLDQSVASDRLLDLIDKSSDPSFQRLALEALAESYRSTDNSSNHHRKRIAVFFLQSLKDERFDPAFLLNAIVESGMPTGSTGSMVEFGQKNLSYESFVVSKLEELKSSPDIAWTWLREIRDDESRDSILRIRAHSLLLKSDQLVDEELWAPLTPILFAVASREMQDQILSLWLEGIVEVEGWGSISELACDGSSLERQSLIWQALQAKLTAASTLPEIQDQVLTVFGEVLDGDTATIKPLASLLIDKEMIQALPEGGEEIREVADIPESDESTDEETPSEQENSTGTDEAAEAMALIRGYLAGFGSAIPENQTEASQLQGKSLDEVSNLIDAITPDDEVGWAVFQKRDCATCHNVHGEGKVVGPDIVDSVNRMTIKEFAQVFIGGGDIDLGPFRAEELELKGGLGATGWILDRQGGVIDLLDLAGNSFSISEGDVHLDRGRIGPIMGTKGDHAWRVDELAALRSYLIGLAQ